MNSNEHIPGTRFKEFFCKNLAKSSSKYVAPPTSGYSPPNEIWQLPRFRGTPPPVSGYPPPPISGYLPDFGLPPDLWRVLEYGTANYGHWGPKYALETSKNQFWGPKTDFWELFQDQNDFWKYSGIFPGHSGSIFNQIHIMLKENAWKLRKVKKNKDFI